MSMLKRTMSLMALLLCQNLCAEDQKPNILLIVADDMGLADIAPFGSEIKTPALSKLAESGIRFSNFHVSPVCSVTRGQLLTGANSIEVGLGSFDYSFYPPAKGKPGYEGYLTDNALSIAELLSANGYNTFHSGKWHLGSGNGHGKPPQNWGFQKTFGVYSGGSAHWDNADMYPNVKASEKALANGKKPPLTYQQFYENGKKIERIKGVFSDDLYTGKMIEYLESGRTSGKPFFAYLALTTAHFPIQAPSALIDKYVQTYRDLGYEGLKKQRHKQLIDTGVYPKGTHFPENNTLAKKWNKLTDGQKDTQARIMATYAAMIESQDFYIGRLIDYLSVSGQLENTLIIYMPDNGPEGADAFGPLSNSLWVNWVQDHFDMSDSAIGTEVSSRQIGLEWANATTGSLQWWKWFISEGGIRVPLIIRPPETSAFKRHGELSNITLSVKDIPATIMSYANVQHPGAKYKGRNVAKPSGISMLPFLHGESSFVRSSTDWFAFELFGNGFVIKDKYKLMKLRKGMYGDGKWHLYDIVNDPGETQPLETKLPDQFESMMSLYKQYEKDHKIVPVAEDWNPWKAAADTDI